LHQPVASEALAYAGAMPRRRHVKPGPPPLSIAAHSGFFPHLGKFSRVAPGKAFRVYGRAGDNWRARGRLQAVAEATRGMAWQLLEGSGA
jgi:hypothetical protein